MATPRGATAGYTAAVIPAAVALTTTSAVLFASSNSATSHVRTISNDAASTGPLLVKFGAAASTTDYTVSIPVGGYYEFPQPLYVGQVTGVLAAGTGSAHVTSY